MSISERSLWLRIDAAGCRIIHNKRQRTAIAAQVSSRLPCVVEACGGIWLEQDLRHCVHCGGVASANIESSLVLDKEARLHGSHAISDIENLTVSSLIMNYGQVSLAPIDSNQQVQ